MNLKTLVNSPHGQFITTLWRGSESRKNLDCHVSIHYKELESLVRNGITLEVDGLDESFNIVVFFVAYLSFVKEILGRCSCKHTFGCNHCQLPLSKWNQVKPTSTVQQNISVMKERGERGETKLGRYPNKDGKEYKDFASNNFGQYGKLLFDAIIIDFVAPCGLHLILANHRYLWQFMFDIISKRKQESLFTVALRKVGCFYLSFRLDCYIKSKKKHYDGSESLKMIGNDCKLLEENIDVFLDVFVTDRGDSWESEKSQKIRHNILQLYKAFKDLAEDIRRVNGDEDRIKTFGSRAESYFKLFLNNTSLTHGLPYLHYLRDHLSSLMTLYYDLFGWGYGYFSTNGGEHLNKEIKFHELHRTNLSTSRFYSVIRELRLKQLCFTKCIIPTDKIIKCSACNQYGHNKKNRS